MATLLRASVNKLVRGAAALLFLLIFSLISARAADISANFALGQDDFVSSRYQIGLSSFSLSYPKHIAITSDRVYVVDGSNQRVLWWNKVSFYSGKGADGVIGQANFTTNRGGSTSTTAKNFYFPYSVSVDSSGYVWVADTDNNRVLRFPKPSVGEDVSADFVLGQNDFTSQAANKGLAATGCRADTLYRPEGVAVTTNSQVIWVTDTYNHRVLMFDLSISTFQAQLQFGQSDFTSRGYNRTNTNTPSAKSLWYPEFVSVSTANLVWVSDHNNQRVVAYSLAQSTVNAVWVLGQAGFTTNQYNRDNTKNAKNNGVYIGMGIAVSTNTNILWVADYGNSRLLEFNLDVSTSVAQYVLGQANFTSSSTQHGQSLPNADGLYNPQGMAMDPDDGSVWVADTNNQRILKYDLSVSSCSAQLVLGQPVMDTNFGSWINNATLYNPGRLAVADNRVYLADQSNHRVLWWESSSAYYTGRPADGVIGQKDFYHTAANRGGAVSNKTLNSPIEATVDLNGKVWIADSQNNRILRFPRPTAGEDTEADYVLGQEDFTQNAMNRFDSSDPNADTLYFPKSIAVSTSNPNVLWVTDSSNNRVLKYDLGVSSCSAQHVLGQRDFVSIEYNLDDHSFSYPEMVSRGVVNENVLWVADAGYSRVLKFDLSVSTRQAQHVLGQADMFNAEMNRGHYDYASADSLNGPYAVLEISSGVVFVADAGNNRILGYNLSVSSSDAQYVIGQADFSSFDSNRGGAHPDANTQAYPIGLGYKSQKLWTSDSGNQRLLQYSVVLSSYLVSGVITDNGVALAGVTVNATGGYYAVTDSEGVYSLYLYDGDYTITPSTTASYSYYPAGRGVTVAGAPVSNVNFLSAHNFTGSVSKYGYPMADVAITVSSGAASYSAQTAADGSFSLLLPAYGEYSAVPSSAGYAFSPVLASTSSLVADWSADFAASTLTYISSGTVTLGDNAMPGVNLTVSGDTSTYVVTDSSGNYSFDLAYGGEYTITPSSVGYVFAPVSVSTANLSGNWVNSFVASLITPVVVQVVPSGALKNTTVSAILTGSSFSPGAAVKLTHAGSSEIVATNVSVVTSSQITCSFSLADAIPGQWSITVVNANQSSSTLVGGFVVVDSTHTYHMWVNTGSMSAAREYFTMTTLQDGRILVAGGYNGGAMASAEVYNPATGLWTSAGALNFARRKHSAQLLPNGKVLVSGGLGTVYVGNSELYDPVTNSWSVTGSLNTPRSDFGMTLLPDGNVLAAGGQSTPGVSNTAEVYDVNAGTWTYTGSMSTVRHAFTLTLLPTGKVLAVGGETANLGGVTNACELYDYSTGLWVSTASMNAFRSRQSTVLLPDGNVLTAGGYTSTLVHRSDSEIFYVATGSWVSINNYMSEARYGLGMVTLPDRMVLAVGGERLVGNSAAVDRFNSDTQIWSAVSSMSSSRAYLGLSALPDGTALAAGGYDGSNYLSSAQIFAAAHIVSGTITLDGAALSGATVTAGGYSGVTDSSGNYAMLLPNGSYTLTPSMAKTNFNPASYDITMANADITGKDFIAIRYPFVAQVVPAIGVKDTTIGAVNITGNNFSSTTSVTLSRNGVTINATGVDVVTSSQIICSFPLTGATTGQWNVNILGSLSSTTFTSGFTVAYPADNRVWVSTASMSSAREYLTLTTLQDGRILAAGGYDGGPMQSAEIYDPATGLWSGAGTPIVARQQGLAVLLPNGKVLVAGGKNASGYLNSAELYDPVANSWTATGSMKEGRFDFAMTLLPDGNVLAVGGAGDELFSVATAEIYDVDSGVWSYTGNMVNDRRGPTLTLLPKGKVLVAGGSGVDWDTWELRPTSSCEIYDYITGQWTGTNGMNSARYGHSATLLADGNVLVAGGDDYDGNTLASSEVFDSGTQSWTLTSGAMHSARRGFGMRLLPDYTVLAAGGDVDIALASADVFNLATGEWTSAVPMSVARTAFGMTFLPDGSVMSAGGGNDSSSHINSVEVFAAANVASGTVTLGGNPMPYVLVSVTGTVTASTVTDSNGRYSFSLPTGGSYVITPSSAGYVFAPASVSTSSLSVDWLNNFAAERVYTASGTVTLGGNAMPGVNMTVSGDTSTYVVTDSSGNYSFSLLSGGSYVITPSSAGYAFTPASVSTASLAGDWQNNFTAAVFVPAIVVQIYPPVATTTTISGVQIVGSNFVTGATVKLTRAGHDDILATGVSVDSASLITCSLPLSGATTGQWTVSVTAGGQTATLPDGFIVALSSDTRQWRFVANMSTSRYNPTVTLLDNGKVLVAGGVGESDNLDTAELYDPVTNTWSPTLNNMPHTFANHAAVKLADGRVLVAGGSNGLNTPGGNAAAIYDPDNRVWASTTSMDTGRSEFTLTFMPNGKVLAAGGADDSGAYLQSAEVYDPATGEWTPTGSMAVGQRSHSAIVLPNGKVLVSGGQYFDINEDLSTEADEYDPGTGQWAVRGTLTNRRKFPLVVGRDGMVYAPGGERCSVPDAQCYPSEEVDVYNPGNGTWQDYASSMNASLWRGVATLLPDGRMMVSAPAYGVQHMTEIFDFNTGIWTSGEVLEYFDSAAWSFLPDGTILSVDLNSSRVNNPVARVSGTVTYNSSGLSGVTMAVTGTITASTTSIESGIYSVNIPLAGNFTMTPSKTDYAFAPVSVSSGVFLSDMVTNFTASKIAYTSSGTVTLGGNPFPDVTLSVSGDTSTFVVTDSSGNYSVSLSSGGSYVITPSSAAYVFTPASVSTASLVSDWFNNFTAAMVVPATVAQIYPPAGTTTTISGVKIAGANFASGSTVKLTRAGYPDITAADVSVISSTQILCSLPLSGATTGQWDLAITSNAETAVSSAAFVVALSTPTRQWYWAGAMNIDQRVGASVIPLGDGTVMVSGGRICPNHGCGTAADYEVTRTWEIYNPVANSWTISADDAIPTYLCMAGSIALPDGQALMVGGRSDLNCDSGGVSKNLYLYNPVSGTFNSRQSMTTARINPTVSRLPDGRVLVAGGNDGGSNLSSVEIYNPLTDSWTAAHDMPMARQRSKSVLLPNGKVLLGCDMENDTAQLDIYNPFADSWDSINMPASKVECSLTLLRSGKVLVSQGSTQSTYTYDPDTNDWATMADGPNIYLSNTMLLEDGRVLMSGQNMTYAYDADNDVWTQYSDSYADAGNFVRLPGGRVLFLWDSEMPSPPLINSAAVALSGSVHYASTGLAGATITPNIDLANTVASDSNGAYSINLPIGDSYNVTPSSSGYTMAPSSVAFITMLSDAAQDFSAYKTLVASGTVTLSGNALPGITVTVSGSTDTYAVTDSSGNYSISLLSGGSYVITPSSAGYVFAPASVSTSSLFGGWLNNFTAVMVHTASGTVTLGGNPMSGVTLAVSGDTSTYVVTDSSGNYSVSLNSGGSYVITPSSAGYVFTPASVSTSSLSGDWLNNFTASMVYTTSGTVTLGGNAMSGVVVAVSGSTDAYAVTDSSGNYSFSLVSGGEYTITPSSTGYIFEPVSVTTAVLSDNWLCDPFSAIIATYTVSGSVMISSVGLAGVNVTVSGSTDTYSVTDSSGNYSFDLAYGGEYTITPSSTGYRFEPVSVATAPLSGPWVVDPFSAVLETYTVSGAAIAGATVTVSGSTSTYAVADSTGNYSITLAALGEYVFTPGKTGFSFEPSSASTSSLVGNWSGVNFVPSTNSYTLSGYVNAGKHGLPSALITVTGGVSTSTYTDEFGAFSFTLLGLESYTLTPSSYGYVFDPVSYTTASLVANDDSLLFDFSRATFTVAGGITLNGEQMAGVNVAVSGSTDAYTVTNSSGNYSFDLAYGGEYTITPSTAGYLFTPVSVSTSALWGAWAVEDFTARAATVTVSGSVAVGTAPLAGVNVAVSGSTDTYSVTDSSGNYFFDLAYGGNYMLTPSSAGYWFNPVSASTVSLAGAWDVPAFAATVVTFTVSGVISNSTGALAGIAVHVSGSTNAYTVTDGSGAYAFTLSYGGDYIVAPSSALYRFTPPSAATATLVNDWTSVDFFSYIATYTVSGTVLIGTSPAVRAEIGVTGSSVTAVLTDDNGAYFLELPAGGHYILTPALAYYHFEPVSASTADLSGGWTVPFFAMQHDTASIYGVITSTSGAAMGSVLVTVSGGVSTSAYTNAEGAYSFVLNRGEVYTVTPSTAHYWFNPEYSTLRLLVNSEENFTARRTTFSVSGLVRLDGTESAGVEMILSGDESGSQVTDSSGAYAFQLLSGGSYAITPASAAYVFAPVNFSTGSLAGDYTQDFAAEYTTHTVSGVVLLGTAPLAGVTVAIGGGASTGAVTDADGFYSIDLPQGGAYTMTPAKAFYHFAPTVISTNSLYGAFTADFAAYHDTYTISGVARSSAGVPALGVVMTVSGSSDGYTATGADGGYSFTLNAGGDYTVTPSTPYYHFAPSDFHVSSLTGDETADFTKYIDTFTVAGNVSSGSAKMAGVLISVSGSSDAFAYTDVDGRYSFTFPALGLYTVTPSTPYYHFDNISLTTVSLVNNWTADFEAAVDTFTVSGAVSSGSVKMVGVLVTVSGSSDAFTYTDSDGEYSFTLNAGGDYTLTPSRANYSFDPLSLSTHALSGNWINNEFAAQVSTYSAGGTIMLGTAPLSGVTVNVYGSVLVLPGSEVIASTVTDSYGNYSFILNGDSDYSLVPVRAHLSFAPASVATATLSGNWLNNDFAASIVTYTVSGEIMFGAEKARGVLVTVSGGASASAYTGSNGEFSFSLPALSSYTLTPSSAGFVFIPVALATASLVGNWTAADFAAARVTHTVSGYVYLGSAPLAGVQVNISGSTVTFGLTGLDGKYTFNLPETGNYTLTPELTYYHFTPVSVSTANLAGDWGVDAFAAYHDTYSISGVVVSTAGANMAGVLMSVSGSTSAYAYTDGSGGYSFTFNAGYGYTVTPSTPNYWFDPVSYATATFAGNATQNFTGRITTYTVSGVVSMGTATLSGVTITLAGDISGSTVTASDGAYSFTLNSGGAYEITPAKLSHRFTPVRFSTGSLAGDYTQNFAADYVTHVVSGTLAVDSDPLPGVTVQVGGFTSTSTVTDSLGVFSLDLPEGGNYTLTPVKAFYHFNPVSVSTVNLYGDWILGTSFTVYHDTYSISGVVASTAGANMAGVLMSVGGSTSAYAYTDGNGGYSFTFNAGYGYTVTPSTPNYWFDPVSYATTTFAGNATQNFTGRITTYTVSGVVSMGTATLSGVTVTLGGDISGSTVTAADGAYSFTLNSGGAYRVTPAKLTYAFMPVDYSTSALANNYVQDFTATNVTHTISGIVKWNGTPISSVTVTVSGSSNTYSVTGADGAYRFTLPEGGSYTVTPANPYYTFSPASVSTASLMGDFVVSDFTASIITYTVSGVVSSTASAPLAGVTLTVTATQQAVSDANGAYSFTLEAGGSYTITPSFGRYQFTPVNYSTAGLNGNIGGVNFTAEHSTKTISGVITSTSNAVMPGILVTVTGDISTATYTDSLGAYSFTLNSGGNYTVTPSTPLVAFTPVNYSTGSLESDVTQNYRGTLGYLMSGTIRINGATVAGATVTVQGTYAGASAALGTPITATVVTDANGNFSVCLPAGGTYTLYPAKDNYVFWPNSYIVPNLQDDKPNQNFNSNSQTTFDGGIVVQGSENGFIEPKKDPAVFRFIPPESGHVSIKIYTLRTARFVKSVDADVVGGAQTSVLWDGRNTDGELVGSGIYIAVVNGAGYSNEKVKIGVLK